MSPAYYNENDQKAAAWLRELMKDGLIPDGEVDERDIREVPPNDLRGFGQLHFFAGIGGWAHALRLAGWPDDRPIVTGSCPCQPFSSAGKRKGTKDERHLWPAFRWLIAQLRPSIAFGEQVASPDGIKWLAGIRDDLESIGYFVGASNLPAAGIGAPHRRQRLFWVANTDCQHGPRLRFHNGASHQAVAEESTEWFSNWRRERVVDRQGNRRTRRVPDLAISCVVNGLPPDMELVRGYGNAIVPQVAAEFITAFIEATSK